APRGMRDFVCDFEKYPREYENFRGKNVTLGLEFGMSNALFLPNKRLANSYDYDFILGAVHGVDGDDIYKVSLDSPEKLSGIDRYLIYSREMVEKYDFIDAFAHIDYVARYTKRMSDVFFYENFAESFDALLKAISERGIAFEINTSRFDEPHAKEVMFTICRRFRELGGRFCTIGSDAHEIKNLAFRFESAKKIAREAELSVVFFRNRKAVRCE
ncbi:MAG: PHP domain-containing protein, partial [Defluviitaleaceae bacterium]|nr:PHP domain-containing protein [Defluviitaleaceae bacterium]